MEEEETVNIRLPPQPEGQRDLDDLIFQEDIWLISDR